METAWRIFLDGCILFFFLFGVISRAPGSRVFPKKKAAKIYPITYPIISHLVQHVIWTRSRRTWVQDNYDKMAEDGCKLLGEKTNGLSGYAYFKVLNHLDKEYSYNKLVV